jgi:acetoin utilization protein AcuC
MLPNFFYSPDILRYDFGPRHPLKPERLRRTIELLGRYGVVPLEPPQRRRENLLRVHSEAYVSAVEAIDRELSDGFVARRDSGWGFASMDNPPFAGMYGASLAYASATAAAAERVRDGAELAFGIGGGLHHAQRERASGFCIFDDPAIACHILRERFDRVAYIDIDVHHGDGVQWIFYEDPSVLTISIHEDGRTLFPGTGSVEETGAGFSSLNIPLAARTTGDVWLDAFEQIAPDAIERFRPGAIVLQMGTDAHHLDPLGHLRCLQQHWLGAVRRVKAMALPIVAIGGGGYNLTTVPRMWTSACLTLGGVEYDDWLPDDLASEWDIPTYSDPQPASLLGTGQYDADATVEWLKRNHLPNIG